MRKLLERLEEKAQESGCPDVKCVDLENWLKKRFKIEYIDTEGSGMNRKAIYLVTQKGRKRGEDAPDFVLEAYWASKDSIQGRRLEVVSMRPDWVTRDRKTFVTPKDMKAAEKWMAAKVKGAK